MSRVLAMYALFRTDNRDIDEMRYWTWGHGCYYAGANGLIFSNQIFR